ncbi:MAG: TIGR00730 family Rossman fold protein [Deltaproteobacteria bacterium]
MKRICVYCGSSLGAKPEYATAARELGRLLAQRNIGLVYGGGGVGLMGEVAKAALAEGGEVIGIIPKQLARKEIAFDDVSKLIVLDTMHERKALMSELADGFITLPGGLGTFEEFFETLTWAQLEIHAKPCGLLNVAGYFDGLIHFLDYSISEQFIHPKYRSLFIIDESPCALLDRFLSDSNRPPSD